MLRPLCYTVHPYRWPTIGADNRHLSEATLEDVRAFHSRFYRPDNALLAIAAPLKHEEMLQKVEEAWPNIKVQSYSSPSASYVLSQDNPLDSRVVVDLAGLSPEDIGIEMIFAVADKKNVLHIQETIEYSVAAFEDGIATYCTSVIPEHTGMYQIGVRLYAKNSLLPHRMDFPLVKWL